VKIQFCAVCKIKTFDPWRVPKSNLIYCGDCAIRKQDQEQKKKEKSK